MKGSQKPQKTKQFSVRTTHSRSASYGRNLNKLGRITSSEDMHHNPHGQSQAQTQRPLLNRSRSTDGTIGRRNRSFTKLAALHPLTRTRSQQNVPRVPSKVVIDLHTNNESSEGEHDDDDNEVEEEEVDAFSDDEIQVDTEEPLKVPSPKPQQVLSYRAPPQFSHKNVNGGFSSSIDHEAPNKSQLDSEQLSRVPPAPSAENQEKTPTPETGDQKSGSALIEPHPSVQHNQVVIDAKKEPSEQELAQYYQNMILSQSTGLVRQFSDAAPFHNSLVPDAAPTAQSQDLLQYIHSNDRISGTITNLKPMSETANSLKQFTIQHTPQQQHNSHSLANSNESSSMLSFRAEPIRRDQLLMTGLPSPGNRRGDTPLGSIETRTQQKLWLQRENSLLDISAMKATTAVTPQARREFERVSREFVNVRRFVNPLSDAVKRVNAGKIPNHNKNSNQVTTPSADHLKSLNAEEVQFKLLKIWRQSERSSPPEQARPQPQRHVSQNYFNHQPQRPTAAQQQSAYSGLMGGGPLMRSPAAPTTRAVDRANNSPENKRIDLAAARLSEMEQIQKLT